MGWGSFVSCGRPRNGVIYLYVTQASASIRRLDGRRRNVRKQGVRFSIRPPSRPRSSRTSALQPAFLPGPPVARIPGEAYRGSDGHVGASSGVAAPGPPAPSGSPCAPCGLILTLGLLFSLWDFPPGNLSRKDSLQLQPAGPAAPGWGAPRVACDLCPPRGGAGPARCAQDSSGAPSPRVHASSPLPRPAPLGA